MTDTGRTITVSLGGDAHVSDTRDSELTDVVLGQERRLLECASEAPGCQEFRHSQHPDELCLSLRASSRWNGNSLGHFPPGSPIQNRYISSSRLRILVLNDKSLPLPEKFLEPVLREDPQAIIRNSWNSVCKMIADDWPSAPHVILGVSPDCGSAIRRLTELWNLRVANNYSLWPIYFAMPRSSQPGLSRFEVERLGGYFLHIFDVPDHFRAEIEQIRLMFGHLKRSLPTWLIVYEGNGATLRAVVYFVHRKRFIQVRGSDRQIAALAVFLKNNGLKRSFSSWQQMLADDLLFGPSGGYFKVPSIGTIKMYVHRDFVKSLQRAFDEYRSGFSAKQVIEMVDRGTHLTVCRIRGERDVSRR